MSLARLVPRVLLVALSLAGCAASPSPVPVQARPDALAALAGEWTGDYHSAATGRSGSIVFTLTAGRDTAFGEVVMVPSGSDQPLAAAATPGAAAGGTGRTVVVRPGAGTRGLTIRFVRVAGDSVSGSLDPYAAPDCSCVLETTFTGRVLGDRIDGTFVTRGDARADTPQSGRWRVTRRR